MPVVHESLLLVAIVIKRLIVTVKHIQKLSENGNNLYFNANHFHDLLAKAFLKVKMYLCHNYICHFIGMDLLCCLLHSNG